MVKSRNKHIFVNEMVQSKFLFQMLEEKNVKFYMKDRVVEIKGENGKVCPPSVVLFQALEGVYTT